MILIRLRLLSQLGSDQVTVITVPQVPGIRAIWCRARVGKFLGTDHFLSRQVRGGYHRHQSSLGSKVLLIDNSGSMFEIPGPPPVHSSSGEQITKMDWRSRTTPLLSVTDQAPIWWIRSICNFTSQYITPPPHDHCKYRSGKNIRAVFNWARRMLAATK